MMKYKSYVNENIYHALINMYFFYTPHTNDTIIRAGKYKNIKARAIIPQPSLEMYLVFFFFIYTPLKIKMNTPKPIPRLHKGKG